MKKVIIGFILGAMVSGLAVYAAATVASDKVSYDNTTSKSLSTNVQGAIDELYSDSLTGKNNIISALINKGFNVSNNATYSDIVNGINELPITLAKDEDGNYGYIITDETGADSIAPFKKNGGSLKISYDYGETGWIFLTFDSTHQFESIDNISCTYGNGGYIIVDGQQYHYDAANHPNVDIKGKAFKLKIDTNSNLWNGHNATFEIK